MGVLVIAHGSRAKQTELTLKSVVDRVREMLPNEVIEIAYMEFGEVNIHAGLSKLVAMGETDIKAVPYFLFSGIHIKEDIPNEIAEFLKENEGITVTLAQTLGDDYRLSEILCDRIKY